MINPLTVGDTYTNLGFLFEWQGELDVSETAITLYTGPFAAYDPGGPFCGLLIVGTRSTTPTLSYVSGSYDVKDKDTLVAGAFSLHARVVHTTGEIETVPNITIIKVRDELPG